MRQLREFGAPPDGVAWVVLAVACVALSVAVLRPKWWTALMGTEYVRLSSVGWMVAGLALSAALLSAGYVAYYLRGGPRIIDATSYWLQARALAEGLVGFDSPLPRASVNGRFLVAPAGSQQLAVIFPPGYPAVLALGFVLGHPLLIGPLVAAALVWATYTLGRRASGRLDVAIVAALLSVLCAALRYHTADSMSHGWAALLLCLTVALSMSEGTRAALGSGLAAGWLFATRPVTGLIAFAVGAWWIASRGTKWRLLWFALALVPGLALLLLEQRAATGSAWTSSQLRYYALSDGPPGCFRYGFGRGIGCIYEHGDFLRAQCMHGYGLWEATRTTGRRLVPHLLDIANFEPLAVLIPLAVVWAWRAREPALAGLGLVVAAVILGYAPFYFDGNYPGGGARLLSDVLPLEHVLLAYALVRLGRVETVLPAVLAGFAVHGAFEHRHLRDRDGGRPMWEPNVLAEAGVSRGLVFVNTDHGFNLGFDPAHRDASSGVVVARWRGDASDWLAWNRVGRPPAYRYDFDPSARVATPRLYPVELTESASLVFEAEHQWPARSLSGGWLHPDFHPAASQGAGLRLRPTPGEVLRTTVEVGVSAAGHYELVSSWILLGQRATQVELETAGAVGRAEWAGAGDGRVRRLGTVVWLGAGLHTVRLGVRGGDVLLDRVATRRLWVNWPQGGAPDGT
ncbi:MAG: hypothetical protein JW940_27740 [Polyangiaceae bacterium]|nr:hypothetical protein [Polyangiaceae bacterium]